MKWAAYHVENGWLVDTGVGGTYSFDVDQAQWFDSMMHANDQLVATDILPADLKAEARADFLFVRVK
jgi:hypothetical protein